MTPDQAGSVALFESLGFRAEALLKDQVRGRDGTPHDLAILSLDLARAAARHRAFGMKMNLTTVTAHCMLHCRRRYLDGDRRPDADRRTPTISPPSALLALTELPRAIAELGSLPFAAPLLATAPRGDGHPVLVLPGFITRDTSTARAAPLPQADAAMTRTPGTSAATSAPARSAAKARS